MIAYMYYDLGEFERGRTYLLENRSVFEKYNPAAFVLLCKIYKISAGEQVLIKEEQIIYSAA